MTTFLDGPATGKILQLKRAPFFLRIVTDGKEWDALDQLDDSPRKEETIYVYEMEGEPSGIHIHASGGRGGFFMSATYRFVKTQPTDAEIRELHNWAKWCERNKPANKKFAEDYLDKSS